MSRLFWFGAGVAAGVAAYRKVNETTRKATPSGMAEQLGSAMRELAGAVGAFGADVRVGMTERETELHDIAEHSPNERRYDVDGNSTRQTRAEPGRRARRAER